MGAGAGQGGETEFSTVKIRQEFLDNPDPTSNPHLGSVGSTQ